MSEKNETLILFLASIIPVGLVLAGLWFVFGRGSSTPIQITNQIISQCNVPNLPEGTFNYGGSTTWATIRRDVDPVLQKLCPKFVFRYVDPPSGNPGSETGIKMLIANQLNFSQSSRSFKPEENLAAQQKGFTLKEIPIAIDGIAIAVNRNLNIPGLTVAQLKDIYTGKITNWQQVGGVNLPITPLTRPKEAGGTVEFFIENVLEQKSFSKNVQYIGTTTEALRKLDAIPGSIYYASAPEVVPQCTVKSLPIGRTSTQFIPPYKEPQVNPSDCPAKLNQLNTEMFRKGEYPITRNLFVIVKQNGQIDQQAGEAYANWLLSLQGQELLEKTGFIRIK